MDNHIVPDDDHLTAALYGAPKVNPDEQRKYLGTFRERVGLTISVAELENRDWSTEFDQELSQSYVQIIFLNGNVGQDKLNPYIKIATTKGINFTLKSGDQFKTAPDNFAIVVANKQAVHISPVDIATKYPDQPQASDSQPKKQSFWSKIFK